MAPIRRSDQVSIDQLVSQIGSDTLTSCAATRPVRSILAADDRRMSRLTFVHCHVCGTIGSRGAKVTDEPVKDESFWQSRADEARRIAESLTHPAAKREMLSLSLRSLRYWPGKRGSKSGATGSAAKVFSPPLSVERCVGGAFDACAGTHPALTPRSRSQGRKGLMLGAHAGGPLT